MSELLYKPKYTNTDEILTLVANITSAIDVLTIKSGMQQNPKLRRANRIKSIHGSLAIENNSLSLQQVTAVINGKPVLAPPQDIAEVENAFKAYEKLLGYNPYDIDDLQVAHSVLMKDLVKEAGQYRSGSIGVVRGDEVVHIAPPPENVSGLLADLIKWVEKSNAHPLIKSCVFHYEFEYIHPFSDGNGRMGRMWQTLLLYQWREIFAWLPVESIVHEHQQEYYLALGKSNDANDCSSFIEFMLNILWNTLQKYQNTDQEGDQLTDQVKKLLAAMGDKTFSAKELMDRLGLNHKPTFRKNYLHPAMEQGLIEMTSPDTPNARNQKYRNIR